VRLLPENIVTVFEMPTTIRPTLVLWGVRMGFMSYGWDAGVLGGVLLTKSFQSAMKVRDVSFTMFVECL
jgi:hypothetical protein